MRWTAGWRASDLEEESKGDGALATKEDAKVLTYQINQELINMIISSPHNKFVAFLTQSDEAIRA